VEQQKHGDDSDARRSIAISHGVQQKLLKDSTETSRSGFLLLGELGNRAQRSVSELEINPVQLEESAELCECESERDCDCDCG
jgi:hypothetical protein